MHSLIGEATRLFHLVLSLFELGSVFFYLFLEFRNTVHLEIVHCSGHRLYSAKVGQFVLPDFQLLLDLLQAFGGQSCDLAVDLYHQSPSKKSPLSLCALT